jgi:hypothetical protein
MFRFSRPAQKFFYCLLRSASCPRLLPLSSPRHDQLRRREHRGHAAVLPAAEGAAHASLARRPLLRACAANIDDLGGVCRSLVGRPIGAVCGFGFRRRALASLSLNGLTLCVARRGQRHCVQSPALDGERRLSRPPRASEQKARADERDSDGERSQKSPASKAPFTRRAEASARPHAPTHARDALSALAAESRPVHRSIPFPLRTRPGRASFRRHEEKRVPGGEPCEPGGGSHQFERRPALYAEADADAKSPC